MTRPASNPVYRTCITRPSVGWWLSSLWVEDFWRLLSMDWRCAVSTFAVTCSESLRKTNSKCRMLWSSWLFLKDWRSLGIPKKIFHWFNQVKLNVKSSKDHFEIFRSDNPRIPYIRYLKNYFSECLEILLSWCYHLKVTTISF